MNLYKSSIVRYCQYRNIYYEVTRHLKDRMKNMQKKIECPNGIPEELCDHAPHCNVWKLREAAKKQTQTQEQ
jgi:hypothetical protein